MKMKSFTKLVLVVGLIACGDGSSSPSSPSPPSLPKANLVTAGAEEWLGLCLAGCSFRAAARNIGSGCAGAVRGTVQFFNEAGGQVGGVYSWSLANDVVVRPNELFSYRTANVIGSIVVNQVRTYRTEFSWTDVAC